jgi:hypothetical protein
MSIQGSGFRVQGSGFRVQGLGFRDQGSGFRVRGFECRVRDSGIFGSEFKDSRMRVWSLGFRA